MKFEVNGVAQLFSVYFRLHYEISMTWQMYMSRHTWHAIQSKIEVKGRLFESLFWSWSWNFDRPDLEHTVIVMDVVFIIYSIWCFCLQRHWLVFSSQDDSGEINLSRDRTGLRERMHWFKVSWTTCHIRWQHCWRARVQLIFRIERMSMFLYMCEAIRYNVENCCVLL